MQKFKKVLKKIRKFANNVKMRLFERFSNTVDLLNLFSKEFSTGSSTYSDSRFFKFFGFLWSRVASIGFQVYFLSFFHVNCSQIKTCKVSLHKGNDKFANSDGKT